MTNEKTVLAMTLDKLLNGPRGELQVPVEILDLLDSISDNLHEFYADGKKKSPGDFEKRKALIESFLMCFVKSCDDWSTDELKKFVIYADMIADFALLGMSFSIWHSKQKQYDCLKKESNRN